MAFPTYTFSFSNSSTIDATQINQDFTDILNGVTDGTKDLKSLTWSSGTSNPASAGQIKLASTDTIKWRNNANAADLALGKDASDNLTWGGTTLFSSTGVLLAAAFPALTGNVTTSAGSLATTIANSAVSNAKMANMSANTIKANNTGGAAAPSDITVAQLSAMFTSPTITVLTSGTNATYTVPANAKWLEVEMWGGGGGGQGSGPGAGNGTTGNNSAFNPASLNLVGTGGASGGSGGNGGTPTGGDVNLQGSSGGGPGNTALSYGGDGGAGPHGGAGAGGNNGAGAGGGGPANTGGGGGGGGGTAGVQAGIGGGAGGYLYKLIGTPAASYTYTVAASATGGATGTGGNKGGSGGEGFIRIIEHYN